MSWDACSKSGKSERAGETGLVGTFRYGLTGQQSLAGISGGKCMREVLPTSKVAPSLFAKSAGQARPCPGTCDVMSLLVAQGRRRTQQDAAQPGLLVRRTLGGPTCQGRDHGLKQRCAGASPETCPHRVPGCGREYRSRRMKRNAFRETWTRSRCPRARDEDFSRRTSCMLQAD